MAVVNAHPTKRFFVQMLTRDIDLADAILDLLDNCIDGILRQAAAPADAKTPYKGFRAEIVATPEKFELTDNCGGIPREIAMNSAFRLGRTANAEEKLATVGMYGIGMKRALFKLGRHSTVMSQPSDANHNDTAYIVDIPPVWLDGDEWELQLQETGEKKLDQNGTQILVRELHETIRYQFDETRSTFLSNLGKEIAQLYSIIINKGFRVRLNGEDVTPIDLQILKPKFFTADVGETTPTIEPYAYKLHDDGVQVDLIVGFYRPLATEHEIDAERHQSRSRDDAGWTIVCNDRVVLHNDKSMRTGWGRGTVPNYHNQFISIAGVVFFRSDHPWKLPLNTTKRGLDTDSTIYMQTLDFMMEGTKKFTEFTNKWKGRESETRAAFSATEVVKPSEALESLAASATWMKVKKTGGEKHSPNLPLPPTNKKSVSVSFKRDKTEVLFLAERLLGDEQAKPADVGIRCWEDVLAAEKSK